MAHKYEGGAWSPPSTPKGQRKKLKKSPHDKMLRPEQVKMK